MVTDLITLEMGRSGTTKYQRPLAATIITGSARRSASPPALSLAGPSDGGEKGGGWPREPDPSSLAEAHLDNKCAGGHDDHGDISFGLSLRRA